MCQIDSNSTYSICQISYGEEIQAKTIYWTDLIWPGDGRHR
jgi:hypothetical protein